MQATRGAVSGTTPTNELGATPLDAPAAQYVSTGALPDDPAVDAMLEDAYERFRDVDDGVVASYIPALACASPRSFGICIAGVAGRIFEAGDSRLEFSIQSVSKPFVFALVCEAIGADRAREHLGVNSTGLGFDSVMAIELNAMRTMNPMVNAGAIATTSLVPGTSADAKWEFVRDGLSRFAGRDLTLDEEVYASEAANNQRNEGMAHLLAAHGSLAFDPVEATDVYTRQCSLRVNAVDLAVMAATLSNGGVNPQTDEAVVSPDQCARVLAVLATAGLYERSGDWLYEVGLPGKSGVSGGMVTTAPGKGGLGSYSPPLDSAGNSVRGILVTKFLSEQGGLNLFASQPARHTATSISAG
jgi:glutaminase